MKFFNDIFLRGIALLLLVTFTFASCINPISGSSSSPPPGEPPVVITPGEGTPRYVYLDSDGKVTDVDIGRTALFVEDNKNAEGALIVSDTVGKYSRVSIYNHNNNSIVSMFYKQGSNFPYYMTIKQDEDTYNAYLSYYKSTSSTYDIVFEKDGEYLPISNLVLNKNIFNVYNDDTELNASQNLRLRNITIALGLWGSLYNSYFFDEPAAGTVSVTGRWGVPSFNSIAGGLKNVFKAVAVIATVVAVVVAPVAVFVNPAAIILYDTMVFVATVSVAIVSRLEKIEGLLQEDGSSPPQVQETPVPVINVRNWYEEKPITNGQEFHIGKGQDILFEFCSPGADFTKIKLSDIFLEGSSYGWEPGNPRFSESKNSAYVKVIGIERSVEVKDKKIDLPPDCFLIRIKREGEGSAGDGKVAYGFQFTNDNLCINGSVQPVEYKYSDEAEPKKHTNMVVVWFCINPKCPDYVDE